MSSITDQNFDQEVLKSEMPVLVDFWAPWCGPCRAVSPIIDELEKEYKEKIKVVKINVDENQTTPSKFGIMSIPTIMIFKNGNPVKSMVGAQGKEALKTAIYAARSNFKTLVLAGESWGGGLMTTTEVENFPGFPEGIQGPDLMAQIRKQAEKYNVEIVQANFQKANYSKKPFLVTAGDKTYETKAMIIATGATHSPLDVPGEEKLIGRGVSYCATCDAAFFRNKDVAVVGGGDSALTEAIFIANFAKNVFLIHRRDSLKACGQMQEKTKEIKNIHFIFNTRVLEILGDQKVEKIRLKTNPSDKSLPTKSNEEIEKIMPAMLQGVVVAKEKDSVTWDIK